MLVRKDAFNVGIAVHIYIPDSQKAEAERSDLASKCS